MGQRERRKGIGVMIVEWDVGDFLGLGFGILTDLGALLDVCGYDASIIKSFWRFCFGQSCRGRKQRSSGSRETLRPSYY